MIQCQSCQFYSHRACTTISTYKEFHIIKNSNEWKCESCVAKIQPVCVICKKVDRRKISLLCNLCNIFYHKACHLKAYPSHSSDLDNWKCNKCRDTRTNITDIRDIILNNPTTPPSTTPKFGRGIKIGHINIRDLMSKTKLNDIKVLLARDDYDVFMVSETWLWTPISNEEISIDGYHLIRNDRANIKKYNSRGGGVVAYIKNDYTVDHILYYEIYTTSIILFLFIAWRQFVVVVLLYICTS
jgi:hypothetical protein